MTCRAPLWTDIGYGFTTSMTQSECLEVGATLDWYQFTCSWPIRSSQSVQEIASYRLWTCRTDCSTFWLRPTGREPVLTEIGQKWHSTGREPVAKLNTFELHISNICSLPSHKAWRGHIELRGLWSCRHWTATNPFCCPPRHMIDIWVL